MSTYNFFSVTVIYTQWQRGIILLERQERQGESFKKNLKHQAIIRMAKKTRNYDQNETKTKKVRKKINSVKACTTVISFGRNNPFQNRE